MKVNEHIAVATPCILLVPYDALHVERYHGWMLDPEIQDLTASEPLSLAEEYENQQSWRSSADKLTFIICLPLDDSVAPLRAKGAETIMAGEADAPSRTIGDINFFLYPYDDDEGESAPEGLELDGVAATGRPCIGEVDIMIASKEHRGRGFGHAAATAFLLYLHRNLPSILEEYARAQLPPQGQRGAPRHADRSSLSVDGASESPVALPPLRGLMAKIKEANHASAALFGRLGFEQHGGVNYFGERELRLDGFVDAMEGKKLGWVEAVAEGYKEVVYSRGGAET